MTEKHTNATLNGVPIFRSGDKVFLIDRSKLDFKPDIDRRLERLTLALDHYRCPFSFLDEFEQWWQWQKRTKADKQSTGHVICSMLDDLKRIKAHKIERAITLHHKGNWNFGMGILGNHVIHHAS